MATLQIQEPAHPFIPANRKATFVLLPHPEILHTLFRKTHILKDGLVALPGGRLAADAELQLSWIFIFKHPHQLPLVPVGANIVSEPTVLE